MRIPIANLYYVFAYACGMMPRGETVETGAVGSPDSLDLLARILADELRRIARRGLARDYASVEEDLARPRGRINVQRSVSRQTRARGRLACSYDELDIDRPFNQIVKATARVLASCPGLTAERCDELRAVVAALRLVSDTRADRAAIRRIQIQGDLRRYRGVLAVCDLVLAGLMPEQGGRGASFADILKDEARMAAIFEEFLRNFYRLEQRTFRVGREVMRWDATGDAASAALLPVMRTDMTLRSTDRVIVADAKYYASAFSGAGEQPKLHSGHLYQLFAYMEHARPPPGACVDGLLIYPWAGSPLSARVSIKGRGVRAESVDLTVPWRGIKEQLLEFLDPAVAY